MPVIPTFDIASIPGAPAQPTANPAAMEAPAAAVAQGGAEVAQGLQDWTARYVEAKRQSDAASLAASATGQLGDAQFNRSKIPDKAAAQAGFLSDAATIRANTLAATSDPLVQSYVARSIDQETALRNLDTGTAAFSLESSAHAGDLNAHLLQYQQQMATATSPALRAHFTDLGVAEINGAIAGNWIRPEEGEQLQANFRSQAAEVAAKQFIITNPDQAATVLQDPKASQTLFPGLLPEHAENLAYRAEMHAYRMDSRANAFQAHADATAERGLRAVQGQNAATLIGHASENQPIDGAALSHLVATQQISESGYAAVLAAQTRAQAGVDTPAVVVDLNRRLNAGTLTDDDVNWALAAHQIKGETAVTLTRAQGELAKTGASAVERGAFSTLKTALSGQAVEQGIFKDNAPEQQKWATAQQEWLNRVTIGRQDPNTVLQDMLPRYTAPATVPQAWPRPRFAAGPIGSTADADAAAVATAKAAAAGQITPAQLDSEKLLINQYHAYFAQQEAAAAAAKTTPTRSGGATVRGLVPTP